MADQDNPQGPPPPEQPPLPGGGDGDNKNILPINIEDEMRRSYLDYAMSVIVGRALPDIRDGLKPVHRRILWSMYVQGFRPDRNHVKCARCYTTFSAKTGQSNNTAITIYVIVGFAIALILGLIVGVLPNLK